MAEQSMTERVAEVLVDWVLAHYPSPLPPRVNVRFLFGDDALAAEVRARLEARSDQERRFLVRRSSDPDAVELRHGRPADVPQELSLVYVLFWLPGSSQHDKNAQSLADLHAKDVEDILADADHFLFPQEQEILKQCSEASLAWASDAHRSRAEEHVQAAFRAVRVCLRQRRGGRQRSIPFVARLEDYIAYLDEAKMPHEELAAAHDRVARIVGRWGEKLARLGMFSLPQLAPLLGVHTDTNTRPPSAGKTREAHWAEHLEELLAENIELAMDYPGLGDAIAGKRTLRQQLDTLTDVVPLCQQESNREVARQALERFCHDGDPAAFAAVEWAFLKDPTTKRSVLLGLKGLLQARGRRAPRPSPLDRAVTETTALFEKILGKDSVQADVLRQLVGQQRIAVAADPRAAQVMIDLLRSLELREMPDALATQDQRLAVEHVLSLPELKVDEFSSLIVRWDELLGHEDHGAEASSLLLGLARLFWIRAQENPATEGHLRVSEVSAGDDLELRVDITHDTTPPRLRLPAGSWGLAARDELSRWLRDKVRGALFDKQKDDETEDEADDEPQELVFHLFKCSGKRDISLGSIKVLWKPRAAAWLRRSRPEVLSSWQSDLAETPPNGAALTRMLLDEQASLARAEAPAAAQQLSQAWSRLRGAEGTGPGWDAIALAGPVCAEARAWVDCWANAIGPVRNVASQSGAATLRDELTKQLENAEDLAEMKRLQAALRALPPSPAASAGPQAMNDARSLLRIGTYAVAVSGRIERLALSPYHPLVLRLRALGDDLLCSIVGRLLQKGWPEEARDVLSETLESWGLPEPMHAYGYWDGDPLVFEAWMDGQGALFTRLGAERDNDAPTLGTRLVAGVVEKYAELFPAAADRLHLRVRGDEEGHWCWGVLSELLDQPRPLRADLDLISALPPRETSAVEQGAYSSHARLGAFELGVMGKIPNVRVRRRKEQDPSGGAHMSLVLGDQIDAFQPSWERAPVEKRPEGGTWDVLDLFAEPTPSLRGYTITVGDPEDALAQDVAVAVGFACGTSGCMFRERFAFDPTRCEPPLRAQQGAAHWLVVASRQPLYRAIQQVGNRVATLLDFYTILERGRPVHICISLGASQSASDLARLDAGLKGLLGDAWQGAMAEGVVRHALNLAPGLAMRCASANGLTHLSGLLGLLLTAYQVRVDQPGVLLLSLDQHRDLLRGGGKLGDLLALRRTDNAVEIAVVEAKFTGRQVSEASSVATKAQSQIASTISRLRHLTHEHPLRLRSRRKLLRAVVHQAHMMSLDEAHGEDVKAMVDALLSPEVPVKIMPRSEGKIHVWSLDASTTTASSAGSDAAAMTIHSRTETTEALRALSGQVVS